MDIVTVRAEVLPELLRAFVQHVRDFDTANPGCHFSIIARTSRATTEIEREVFDTIEPALPVRATILKQ